MTNLVVRLSLSGELKRSLSALTDAAKVSLEVRNRLLGLLKSGEELFSFDSDGLSASITNEVVVSLYPSDRLAGLLTAARAGN